MKGFIDFFVYEHFGDRIREQVETYGAVQNDLELEIARIRNSAALKFSNEVKKIEKNKGKDPTNLNME